MAHDFKLRTGHRTRALMHAVSLVCDLVLGEPILFV
jgi:hypothetical protein